MIQIWAKFDFCQILDLRITNLNHLRTSNCKFVRKLDCLYLSQCTLIITTYIGTLFIKEVFYSYPILKWHKNITQKFYVKKLFQKSGNPENMTYFAYTIITFRIARKLAKIHLFQTSYIDTLGFRIFWTFLVVWDFSFKFSWAKIVSKTV